MIFHIFIISCLCSRFHVRNQWFFYAVITFSYTKCFVHSYTVDVVFTLSYKWPTILSSHASAPRLALRGDKYRHTYLYSRHQWMCYVRTVIMCSMMVIDICGYVSQGDVHHILSVVPYILRKADFLFPLLQCRLWSVQIIWYSMACKTYPIPFWWWLKYICILPDLIWSYHHHHHQIRNMNH